RPSWTGCCPRSSSSSPPSWAPRRPCPPHPAGPPDRRPPGDHRGAHRPAISGPPPHASPAALFLSPEHRPDSPRSVPPSAPWVVVAQVLPGHPPPLTGRNADPFGSGLGLDASRLASVGAQSGLPTRGPPRP